MLTISNQLYISAELAVQNGVRTDKYQNKSSWDYIKLSSKISDQYIRRSVLSKYDKRAIGSIQSIKKQIGLQNLLKRQAAQELRLKVIKQYLQKCNNEDYDQFAHLYVKLNITPKQVVKYCQEHAILAAILFLTREKGFKQTEILQVLPLIEFNKFDCKQTLSRKLSEIKLLEVHLSTDQSIKKCIVSKSRGVERPERRLVSDWHLRWIFYFYCKKNFGYSIILKQVNRICDRFGKNRIELHNIKKELRSNYVKNLLGLERYGYEWLKKRVLPYIDKLKPTGFLTILQIDGSRLQLPYYDLLKKRVEFLTIFVLLDVCTSKIVGYWLDRYENRYQVLNAFLRFFNSYQYLPKLIVHDGSSAYRTEEFLFFKERAIEMGVKFRKHSPTSPNEKGQVERFFQIFCERICKLFQEYTGLSLVAKDPNFAPNKQKVTAILKNHKKLKTRQELILTVDQLISEYNQLNISNLDSPNQKEKKSTIDAISLEKHQLALLTWRIKENKAVSRSEVKFYYKGTPYKYKIRKMNNILRLNGGKVIVAWNPTDLNQIFLFDSNYRYLETCFKKTLHPDDVTRMKDEKLETDFFKEVAQNKQVHKKISDKVQNTIKQIEESFNEADYLISLNDSNKERSTIVQNAFTRKFYELEPNDSADLDDYELEKSSDEILAYIDNLDHGNDY
ncbi:hypothetical protein [Reichenbachiella sp.]|uniref:hypothetical protein n=1 Tax=Reichenbachiella sp. TaxID=2184521 RepID=UPI003297F19C